MENYQAFHVTTIGYSHILKNICCEDASYSLDDGDIHIAVVSDGHGDPACFRSQIGSQLAVEIAAENLLSFARNIRELGWEAQLFDPVHQERLLRQLIRSIIGNWNLKIREQLERSPIAEEEFSVSRDYEPLYRTGEQLSHIFGCTLIATLVTDRYLLALQQGDGRCVVVHGDYTVDQPVPWDTRCVGNICTSLCHADAVESCRYYVADLRSDPIVACFAVSDGVEDSLDSQEDVNAFVCNAASILMQQGADALLEQLRSYLPRMSQTGSADDMSMAGIVAGDADPNVAKWLELVYLLSAHRTASHSASGKVGSMKRKSDFLYSELVRAQEEYDTVSRAMQENLTLLDQIKQELRRAIHARDHHTQILESAQRKLEKAREEYEEYCQKRNDYADKARRAQEDMQKVQQELDELSQLLPKNLPQGEQPRNPDWELPEALIWEEAEALPDDAQPSPQEPVWVDADFEEIDAFNEKR